MEEIKIIIADDNKAWTDLLSKYLAKYKELKILGITNDGEEQIEMIKKLKPDIVITDLKRDKGISGVEVIERCYKLNIKTDYLVTTAGYYNNKIQELRQMGITHFLFKPFDIDDLIKKIKNIQNERQAKLLIIETAIENKRKNLVSLIIERLKKIKIILRKEK